MQNDLPRLAKRAAVGRHHHGLPQHPHRQIELRDSPSSLQQFKPHRRQHLEDDADRQTNEPPTPDRFIDFSKEQFQRVH
jgi:hypothetical protein